MARRLAGLLRAPTSLTSAMDMHEALRVRKAAVREELRGLWRQERRLQDSARHSRTRPLSLENLSLPMRQLLMCAFWMVSFVHHDALVLLDHVRRPLVWGTLDAAGREALLEDVFTDTEIDDIALWMDEDEADNAHRLRELWTLKAEWKCAKWVGRVNAERGVAPSSRAVVQMYNHYLEACPEHLRPHVARSAHARVCWCERWRERWGAYLSKLKMGHLDPPDILCNKACFVATLDGHGGSPRPRGACSAPGLGPRAAP